MKNGEEKIDMIKFFKKQVKRRSEEAAERNFFESFDRMKNDAINGNISSEVVEKLCDSGNVLQISCEDKEFKESIREIFDTLLETWERRAKKGEFDVNDIESYMLASNKLSIPIEHNRLKVIMDIAQEAGAHQQYERRYKMTDEEYVDLLKSATDEYIRLGELEKEGITEKTLKEAVDRLAATAKFARVVGERAENAQLCKSLSDELKSSIKDYNYVVDAVEISGINDALSNTDRLILRELRLSVLPAEEQEYLKKCGRENPESYLKLLMTIAKSSYEISYKPKNIFDDGRAKIRDAAKTLIEKEKSKKMSNPTIAKPRKKRRICFGIAKILEGAVTAGADIAGAVISGGGVPAYLALASTTSSIMAIHDGLKSFRAE
jgi:hypothetical protein